MTHIVITGGANGLGKSIDAYLRADNHTTVTWDLANGVDVADWQSVRKAADLIDHCDVLINCAGVNRIAWLEDLSPEDFEYTWGVNAMGIFNCVQALLHQLHGGTVCNIISNAAHMPMTASLAYNASKAAAAMITRQMAHELWPRHGIVVFGVSPNKLAATGMSHYTAQRVPLVRGWSTEEAHLRQQAALPLGKETPPELVAEFIAFLLAKKTRHMYLHGTILPYGGPSQ
jgi:NAD(P)-dependent dehydrogenase (short-subunit alcohol dehydrogenase family)